MASMANNPLILLVSPDAVDRDELVDRFRAHCAGYRVMGAASLNEAADVLGHVVATGTGIALVISVHQLPDGSATELLVQLKATAPGARRILLTTLDQADAALQAISQALVDRYLVLPAECLAERLLPIVDDLLEDWATQYRAVPVGVTVLGHRFAAGSHLIKDYLTRSLIPFTWLDLAEDAEAMTMARDLNLPVPPPTTVLFDDGRALYDPSINDLAVTLGLTEEATLDRYDLIVVGGGPAGLAAAVNAATDGLSVCVVEDDCPGGQATAAISRLEDHAGLPTGLTGADFAHRALAQARRLGVQWCSARVAEHLLPLRGSHRVVLAGGDVLAGKTVLIATGMSWRRLESPGVAELTNAGVYYGIPLAEVGLTSGEDVVVSGSGDAAAKAALNLAEHARAVVLSVAEPSLRRAPLSAELADLLSAHERITVHCGTHIGEVRGYGRLEKVVLMDHAGETTQVFNASSLYVLTGMVPSSQWVRDVVALDELGFVLTGVDVARRPELLPQTWDQDRPPLPMETSVPGVFAAGDVRAGSIKRIGGAIGQGGTCVAAIGQYLEEHSLD
ncbi:MAG TPA: FAD-dependent oxidoreductase [Actinocrinis sp.]|nr:FAD-dependent oxidoreductase [Actinocrinis sp.]